jgi:hypothetical protein
MSKIITEMLVAYSSARKVISQLSKQSQKIYLFFWILTISASKTHAYYIHKSSCSVKFTIKIIDFVRTQRILNSACRGQK